MRFQSALVALPLILSSFAVAQHNLNGYNLHARRSGTILRAREAAAELDFYNALVAREAEAEADHYNELIARDAEPELEYFDELMARDAEPEPDFFEDLVARGAEPEFDYFKELVARDAEAEFDHFDHLAARDADHDCDHTLYARYPGSGQSRSSSGQSGPIVSPNPPKIPKLKKCALCHTMCAQGANWCRGPLHPGVNGACNELPGQVTKRDADWAGEEQLGF